MSVGIVGAGITGLATVHHCRKRGIEATCFEARAEPGGVIRSFRVGKRGERNEEEDRPVRNGQDDRGNESVLEAGPQRLRLTEGIEELIDDLDLWPAVLAARDDLPLFVYCDGKLREVPRSLGAFVRTDLLSALGKLRVLCEPLTNPGRPDESAAALFIRKFGRQAYENLVGPLFGGTYGSDPARMPARHALAGLLQLEAREGSLLRPALKRILLGGTPPPISFEEGLQTLPQALYEAHSEYVHLATPVTTIRRVGGRVDGANESSTDGDSTDGNDTDGSSADGSSPDEGGFALVTPAGEQEVDRVVVTADAGTAADLLEGMAGVHGTNGLRELRYNPLAVVHLESEFRGSGFGYQISSDEGFDTLGVTWNASLFDRDGIYTAFLGGMGGETLLDRGNRALGRIAAREFEAILDYPAEVRSVTRWEQGFPAYDASWDALDSLSLPHGVDLATNYTARAGVSGRITQAKRLAERLAGEQRRETPRPSTTT